MKKVDIAVIGTLFLLLMSWPYLCARIFPSSVKKIEPDRGAVSARAGGTNVTPVIRAQAAPARETVIIPAATGSVAVAQSTAAVAAEPTEGSRHTGTAPVMMAMTGTSVRIDVSSWGGGIVSATLMDYRQSQKPGSGPVQLDFSGVPALTYSGLPDLTTNCDFSIVRSNGTVHVGRETTGGLKFERSISIGNNSQFRIVDVFSNNGKDPVVLPIHSLNLGPMRHVEGETQAQGYLNLGIDSQETHGGAKTRHWGAGSGGGSACKGEPSLADAFQPKERRGGCLWFKPELTEWLEPEVRKDWVDETDWLAVKNKFFAQVLIPQNDVTGSGIAMRAKRDVVPAILSCRTGNLKGRKFEIRGERTTIGSATNNSIVLADPSVSGSHACVVRDGYNYVVQSVDPARKLTVNQSLVSERRITAGDTVEIGDCSFVFIDGERPDVKATWARTAVVKEVAASLNFEEKILKPGESFTRELDYYVGPKKYSLLKEIGTDSVMEFGFWTPVCKLLLWLMNAIHGLVPNYGIVIILLTILTRLVFWPVMQKSTENMRKMQALQPQLNALKEEYKNDQQKMLKKQQELFKENKVSPLGGCLPMLVQIPILFALFVVLRSAVELRFAPFLWIKDLSEPEALFAGFLPFWPHHLNILPILMTVVQIWQQKLTPTPGDAMQQRMMMVFMPLMMLFMFYDMASALVLYWTTSQFLAIAQILIQNKTKKTDGLVLKPAKA